jgi:sugar-specific transcriptional regulator TrmB
MAKEKLNNKPRSSNTPETKASDMVNNNISEIVNAFKTSKIISDSYYFSEGNRDSMIADFREYVSQNYESGIVSTITRDISVDQLFTNFAQK